MFIRRVAHTGKIPGQLKAVAHTGKIPGQLKALLRVDAMPKSISEKTLLATADVQTQRTYALCLAIPSGTLAQTLHMSRDEVACCK